MLFCAHPSREHHPELGGRFPSELVRSVRLREADLGAARERVLRLLWFLAEATGVDLRGLATAIYLGVSCPFHGASAAARPKLIIWPHEEPGTPAPVVTQLDAVDVDGTLLEALREPAA